MLVAPPVSHVSLVFTAAPESVVELVYLFTTTPDSAVKPSVCLFALFAVTLLFLKSDQVRCSELKMLSEDRHDVHISSFVCCSIGIIVVSHHLVFVTEMVILTAIFGTILFPRLVQNNHFSMSSHFCPLYVIASRVASDTNSQENVKQVIFVKFAKI